MEITLQLVLLVSAILIGICLLLTGRVNIFSGEMFSSGKLLNGVSPKLACPCGYVDHGSYACCKSCAGGKEDTTNCPKFTNGPGSTCSNHTDCDGFVAGKVGSLACCNGKCTPLVKDWAGIGFCPADCRDAPAPLGKPCESGNTWPRSEGQPCDTHVACKGWMAGKAGTLACCNGKCTKQVKDWAGVGYCPADCRNAPTSKPGSCV